MIHIKNKTTSKITTHACEFLQLSKNIRDQNELATQAESDAFDLQESKDLKLAQIVPARDAFMYSDIEYNGSFFTNSLVSGNNLTSALAIMGTSIDWLDTSGNSVSLTKAEAKELAGLMLDKRSLGYFKEATLIKQINAIDIDGSYVDADDQTITPLDALELITIEF